MTKPAYWDFFGGLWQEHESTAELLVFAWSPFADVTGIVAVERELVERALGPLVGVA